MFAEAGDFITKEGLQARVEGRKPSTKHWVRVHWVPYHVPMASALKQLDAIQGITIVSASYDKVANVEGMGHVRSTLRTVLIDAPDRERVPFSIRWNYEGESGLALVSMKGRAPACLKCGSQAHMRKDCDLQKKRGYAAAVGGSQAVFDEAAEVHEEDLMESNDTIVPPTPNITPAMSAVLVETMPPNSGGVNFSGEATCQSAVSAPALIESVNGGVNGESRTPSLDTATDQAVGGDDGAPAVLTADAIFGFVSSDSESDLDIESVRGGVTAPISARFLKDEPPVGKAVSKKRMAKKGRNKRPSSSSPSHSGKDASKQAKKT
jgi:hypothetical protein